ncbi:MAG TPA: chemotaxis protein CheW [bacterium]|nr:chemotaxis protein CheW [bacterium]HPO09267.1 chemotaxis protein CheW [bacterium]HQO35339.1 chemotaxis protein CheW [bacterium]HQP99754.1 chemotaxis protein CheW [bacterium]
MAENLLSAARLEERMESGERIGKYLTFRIAREEYGIEILKVFEIISLLPITEVPRTPKFVRGVINLRGKIIPVVDLRLKFGLPEIGYNERTCIIIVQIERGEQQIRTGVVVDNVCEVVNLTKGQFEPTPSFGPSVDTKFILGIGKVADRVILLLDVDEVLSVEEIGIVGDMARQMGTSVPLDA